MRFSFAVLDRLEKEVEKVQERARKVAAILDQHGIPYQIIGGIAVYSWIVATDPIAARNTQDVNISARRADLPRVQAALAEAGYRYNETFRVKMLLEPGVQPAETRSKSSSRERKCVPNTRTLRRRFRTSHRARAENTQLSICRRWFA